jgi:CheY-like chemotaxis protein
MVIISGYFAGDIVTKHIASYGSEVVSVSARNVDSYLTGFCIALEYVSVSIERLYSNGADTTKIKNEVEELTEWIRLQNRFGASINVYCYVYDTFIDGNKWPSGGDDYVPQTQSWYTGAYEYYGEIFFSDPSIDFRTGRGIVSVSKVMFDDNNKAFGAAAIDIFISEIANHIEHMNFPGGGYGILLDSDRRYVIFPEEELIGMSLESVNEGRGGFRKMADILIAGEEINAFHYKRYNGEPCIAFIKHLSNGWYIGFVSPQNVYYNEAYLMRFILIIADIVSVILVCSVLTYMHIRVKRSDETNRMKSSFLAKMSHEMRTPMNAILGMSEYLKHEQLNEQQMNYINDINYSANSFLYMIDDLLDLSNIESDEIAHNIEETPEEGKNKETEKSLDRYVLRAPSANILVVDDDELNIKTAFALFSLLGITPKTVLSGKEAIELIKKEDFDIVFMDQMMPETDGIETTQQIRKWEREYTGWRKTDRIPIIALTANAVEGAREMFLDNGFNGYIAKPAALNDLKKILFKWLPGRKVKLTEKAPVSKIKEKYENNEIETEFRKKLQLLFAKKNQNLFDEINTALKTRDFLLARRLAHTLKSSAALIGKTSLQHIAADIEQQLKDSKNPVTEEQLQILENELNLVLNEFAPLFDELQLKTQVQQPLDITAVQELTEIIEPLVKMGNPESLKFIASLSRIPYTEELIEKIEDFDFDEALVSLKELKKRLGI